MLVWASNSWLARRDPEAGEPALVGLPVDLEHAEAAAGARRDVRAVVALAPGDAQGLVLEVVGPDVANHLLDGAAVRHGVGGQRDATTIVVVAVVVVSSFGGWVVATSVVWGAWVVAGCVLCGACVVAGSVVAGATVVAGSVGAAVVAGASVVGGATEVPSGRHTMDPG